MPAMRLKRSGGESSVMIFRIFFPIWIVTFAASWDVTVTHGQNATQEAPRQIVLTRWALRHIQQRHWPDSSAQGAGKFAPGITEESLRDMLNEAVANGRSRENIYGRPGRVYEYDFDRVIGIKSNGHPATRLRVVINPRGQVVTAFPF